MLIPLVHIDRTCIHEFHTLSWNVFRERVKPLYVLNDRLVRSFNIIVMCLQESQCFVLVIKPVLTCEGNLVFLKELLVGFDGFDLFGVELLIGVE